MFLWRKWKDVNWARLLVFYFFFLLETSVAFLGILCREIAPGTHGSPWNWYQNWGFPLLRKAVQAGQKGKPRKGQLKSY